MSRRISSNQSNTLLNYFQSPKGKSVPPQKNATPSTSNETPAKPNGTPAKSNGTPAKTNGTPAKKRRQHSPKSDSDEEPVVQTPKRSKRVIDSDSDSDSPKAAKKSKQSDDVSKKMKQFTATAPSTPSSSTASSSANTAPSTPSASKPAKHVPISSGDSHSNWLHNDLKFLQIDHIKDANGHRPDHPEYDCRTLYVPRDHMEKQTPAMRQWWELKSKHMDSVLFFKVGKFYELYHMDAVVGVKELGFSYMKGEVAHSGFPEGAYHKMANALIEKGYKVARSEQTETPDMMEERCKTMKSKTKVTKFDRVVNREICQVSTKATCVYSAQLPDAMGPLPCYLFAIAEQDPTAQKRRFGICFVDTSIGTFHLAEFDDDKHCSDLLATCSEFTAGLFLLEKRRVSPKLRDILDSYYSDIKKDYLTPEKQFYAPQKVIELFHERNYFANESDEIKLPELLAQFIDGFNPKPEYELAVKALGACVWYLEDSKLDIQVISMGKFELYQPLNMSKKIERKYMVLDSITLTNLNLLGGKGSLQHTLDFCCTAFGKRLLQQWICRPLCALALIGERQEAVRELSDNATMLREVQEVLKKLPDLERQLAKIHTYGNKYFAKDHPDSRAIFYETATYSKRRIGDLLSTLRGFELAKTVRKICQDAKSPLLKRLTQCSPNGNYVDLSEDLEFFKGAFDQEEAQKEGKIIPKSGVDDQFDDVEATIADIHKQLDQYLTQLQKQFGCKVSYFGSDKKRFQIEVPNRYGGVMPDEFEMEGSRKGAKRYSTSISKQYLADMMKAEAHRAKIVQDLNRTIFEKFSRRQAQWQQAIDCLGNLDVLCSLAQYGKNCSGDVCLPDVQPLSNTCHIQIKDGRHPCIDPEGYVPNDTTMGTEHFPNVLIITGPNMGGKSTLMRQVALICIMAQIGGYVPASSCNLTLIDRVFTRLGARDEIVQGQSTFLVELSEASAILQHATGNSLVLLDELGRGTSTHDGTAIATAYVEKLTQINCRTLFSTHYHSLVDQFDRRIDVQLGHMACLVENGDDPSQESVTFLYKMAQGRCPKSYGFNVAKLAGLKHSIVSRGRELAKMLELENAKRRFVRQLSTMNHVDELRKSLRSLEIVV